jgi:hypothetical protein
MAGIDINSILGLVGSDGINEIAKLTKIDGGKVTAVLTDALPVLVGKMSDNASTKEGAASLNKALNDHKTGDVIDVASFLDGVDSKDGKKILGHILGDDQKAATKALSKKSGLSGSKVGSILSMVAPLLLSQLGNQKDDDDDSGSSLGGLLGGLLGGGGGSSSSGGIGASLLGGLLGSAGGSSSSGGLLGGLLGGLGGLFGGGKKEEKEEETGSSGSALGGLLGGLFGGSSSEEKKTAKKKTGTASAAKKKTSSKKTGTTAAKKKTAKKK